MHDLEKYLQQLPETADKTIFVNWEMDATRKSSLIRKLRNANKKRRSGRRLAVIVAAVLIAATITAAVPAARAGMQQVLAEAVRWVSARTNIPIYIPEGWPDDQERREGTHVNEPTVNYYFEVTATKDGYNINVYNVKEPIPINQANQLRIPLSESQYVGSISGYLRQNAESAPTWDKTKFETIELGNNVTAYNFEKVEIYWEKDDWRYWVVGHDAIDYARKLADAIKDSEPLPKAENGWVKVIIGNAVTVNLVWNQEDYQYKLTYRGGDMAEALEIARDATLWIDKNNSI